MSEANVLAALPVSIGRVARVSIFAAALALHSGAAFAENPDYGRVNVTQPNEDASEMIDRSMTGSIDLSDNPAPTAASDHFDPAANRYGDGAPYAIR